MYPHWWRVLVVVSRGGLIPKAEMDYWNFYGARHAATEGVRSYDGNPSFFEATQGKMPMKTDINPKTLPKITDTPAVSFANLGTEDWRGVRLDQLLPGRIKVGQTVTISGTVTATERSDFHQALLSFNQYTKDDIDNLHVDHRGSLLDHGDRHGCPKGRVLSLRLPFLAQRPVLVSTN